MTSTPIEEIRQRAEAATEDDSLIERLNGRAVWHEEHGAVKTPGLLREAADRIEKLEERCEGYKGQVKAGGEEIERLRAEREELVKALSFCQSTLAQLVDRSGRPSSGVNIASTYAQCVAAETRARSLLSALQSGPTP